jgi:tRNA uridine 5-carboxymethylaminomethyl modification enzyme
MGHVPGLRRPERRRKAFAAKREALGQARASLTERSVAPSAAERHGLSLNRDGARRTRPSSCLSYPHAGPEAVLQHLALQLCRLSRPAILEQLAADSLYAGYLERQEADIAAFQQGTKACSAAPRPRLPRGRRPFRGLGPDIRSASAPATLGQASRIEGMTPAAVTAVLLNVRIRAQQSA